MKNSQFYYFDDYAETYRDRFIYRVEVPRGNVLHYEFIMLDDEFFDNCKLLNIKNPTVTINDSYRLGGGSFAIVSKINETTIKENSICCYMLERVRNIFPDMENIRLHKGWSSAYNNPKVFINPDSVIDELVKNIMESEGKSLEIIEKDQKLRERMNAVKFKNDPDYYLVKPKTCIL